MRTVSPRENPQLEEPVSLLVILGLPAMVGFMAVAFVFAMSSVQEIQAPVEVHGGDPSNR
jgi:hypothetical protein